VRLTEVTVTLTQIVVRGIVSIMCVKMAAVVLSEITVISIPIVARSIVSEISVGTGVYQVDIVLQTVIVVRKIVSEMRVSRETDVQTEVEVVVKIHNVVLQVVTSKCVSLVKGDVFPKEFVVPTMSVVPPIVFRISAKMGPMDVHQREEDVSKIASVVPVIVLAEHTVYKHNG